jgi:GDP-L-fucose synthase
VFHFASKIAGLGYNSKHPAEMMTYNTILDLQVLEAAARNGVPLFVYPSGALVYDRECPVPISEDASTRGEPLEACKGASWAKRTGETASALFGEEFGMRTAIIRFSNLFGPGDDFDPQSAHLIGNVVRLVANGEDPEIWGDGSQFRSYLYISDAIEALDLCLRKECDGDPVNIGGTVEYSVRDVVEQIIEISGKPLKATFRSSSPTGLSRKLLDISRFQELTGFKERISLYEGLRRTYEWYQNL